VNPTSDELDQVDRSSLSALDIADQPQSSPPDERVEASQLPVLVTRFGIYFLALPALALLWFIHRYSVNMIFADQWHDINIVFLAHQGTLNVGALWTQHGENRILVPDLLVLALAHTVHFNIVFEDYVSGLLLIGTAALFVLAHKRRSPSTPWIYYFPAVVVLLSLNQGTMVLWGFAASWYLEVFALALAIFLLDRVALGWIALAGAIVATVAGSFSSLEGLMIWPVGLVLLIQRRRGRSVILTWIIAAVATTCLYMFHFSFTTAGTGTKGFIFSHPLKAVRFFFFGIGDVFGAQVPNNPSPGDYVFLLLGVLIFVIAIWVLIVGLPRRDQVSASPIGVAMVLFGLIYNAALTEARASLGLSVLPRYAIFELLILAGCYFAALDGSLFKERTGRIADIGRRLSVSGVFRRLEGADSGVETTPSWTRVSHIGIRACLVVAIFLQVIVGTSEAFNAAGAWHQQELVAEDVAANIRSAPDSLVQTGLGSSWQPVSFIRSMARVAMSEHLSFFNTAAAASFTKEGLVVDRALPVTRVLVPKPDATMTGTVNMVARASEAYGIAKVEFTLSGGTYRRAVIATAKKSFFGWITTWDSSTVPNGSYLLRSVAYDSIGTSNTSHPVHITVRN
jgi:hypothetical protein